MNRCRGLKNIFVVPSPELFAQVSSFGLCCNKGIMQTIGTNAFIREFHVKFHAVSSRNVYIRGSHSSNRRSSTYSTISLVDKRSSYRFHEIIQSSSPKRR